MSGGVVGLATGMLKGAAGLLAVTFSDEKDVGFRVQAKSKGEVVLRT